MQQNEVLTSLARTKESFAYFFNVYETFLAFIKNDPLATNEENFEIILRVMENTLMQCTTRISEFTEVIQAHKRAIELKAKGLPS